MAAQAGGEPGKGRTHASPAAQRVPHAPQLSRSIARLVHTVPPPTEHAVRWAAQPAAHIPIEHTRPAPQTCPQTPQLAGSLPR